MRGGGGGGARGMNRVKAQTRFENFHQHNHGDGGYF